MSTESPARIEKAKEVELIKASFQKATSMVVLGYQGMDVPSVTELRARFRKAGVEYRVVKNSLFHQAIKGTPLAQNKDLDKALTGMNGIAFSFEDPSAAAKIVKTFRKEGEKHEKLQVKAGILESSVMAGSEVESTLATMEVGECFGELAVIDESTRSADVLSNTESVVLKISSDALKKLFREAPALAAPFLLGLSRTLTGRIRHLTKRFEDSVHFARTAQG